MRLALLHDPAVYAAVEHHVRQPCEIFPKGAQVIGQGLEIAELEITRAAVALFNGEEPVPPKGGARSPKA